jgi:hypothetical protein
MDWGFTQSPQKLGNAKGAKGKVAGAAAAAKRIYEIRRMMYDLKRFSKSGFQLPDSGGWGAGCRVKPYFPGVSLVAGDNIIIVSLITLLNDPGGQGNITEAN